MSLYSANAIYEVKIIRDQTFSMAGGKPRLADLYLPVGAPEPLPVVLWVHGGGWRFGDRMLAPDLSRFFAQRGFAMVSFDYRLSDEVKFPAPVEDVKTAIRWVRSIAGQYDLDSLRIALWGSSAGGHLSACAALSTEDRFLSSEHPGYSSSVAAVVDGYGPTDFSRMDADRIQTKEAASDVETRIVKPTVPTSHADSYESRLIGCAVGASPNEVQKANPINYVRAGAPPFLILHGQSDTLVPWQQSSMLFEALVRAKNEATLILLEKLSHGFFNNSELDTADTGEATTWSGLHGLTAPSGIEPRAACFTLVESFLRTHLCQ